MRTDPKDFPDSKQFKHAYHHPEEIRPEHFWVDWFTEFDAGDKRQNGLEFIEGLWADKLALLAILATIAIVVVSIVWCVLGGNLQTVFTVMSFVLTLVAGKFDFFGGRYADRNSGYCIGGTLLSNCSRAE